MSRKHSKKNRELTAFTAHTFIPDFSLGDSLTLYDFCNEMAGLYGHIKRKLFRDNVSHGKPINGMEHSSARLAKFKNDYVKEYGITARQFNSIRFDLQGNLAAVEETLSLRISNLKRSIKSGKRFIKNKRSRIEKIRKDKNLTTSEKNSLIHRIKFQLHNKKRRLLKLLQKLNSHQRDKAEGKIRICFGSKKLFNKQFNLRENGYASHEEWLKDWREARDRSFMFVGSKDENSGNQTCTLSSDGTLRIRAPNCLIRKYGHYINVHQVKYPYGQEIIDKVLKKGGALTHRFVRGKKGWYLHTTVDYLQVKRVTHHPRAVGCIGIDFNEKEVAVTETDRYGNLVWYKTYPACVGDKSSSKTEAIYGDISKEIVERSILTGKPIGHERLDFQKKKSTLREEGKKYARMLSGLAYSTFLTMLDRRAYKNGVEIYTDNPAYTSVVGKVKFMSQYGLKSHEAAAFVIARRIQSYSESPPSRTAFSLPARNRGKHVWSLWRKVSDKVCGRHLTHRLYFGRSLQDSTGRADNSPILMNTYQTGSGKASCVIPAFIKENPGVCENHGGNP